MSAMTDTATNDPALALLLRRHDHDRFLLALFAPADRRDDIRAIYAFNAEIALIKERVSEAMLGQIRLQWWRDGIAAIYRGEVPRRHEVLTPLAAAIGARGLTEEHFHRLLDARERDLAAEPPATLAALQSYAEETAAPLQFLVLEALAASSPAAVRAAREAAIAHALMGVLRATPHLARQRRILLPRALVEETGLDPESLFAGRPAPALIEIARRVAGRAGEHLAAAVAVRPRVARAALPALLPAILADADLKRLRRVGFDLFAPAFRRDDSWRAWRLTWAMLVGKY